MRIAVYSGSFNPLHIGHLAIMEYLTSNSGFDMIYLIVSPKNPLKQGISADTGWARYHAARRAVKRHPELQVWVDDIELMMPPPQYTIRTLDALRQREPKNEFTLVIGADNLENIHRWRDFQRILCEYGVAVYPRKGFDIGALKKQLQEESLAGSSAHVLDYQNHNGMNNLNDHLRSAYKIDLLDAPLVEISSTEIREGFSEGKDMSEWLM